jgi:hypothetical protein
LLQGECFEIDRCRPLKKPSKFKAPQNRTLGQKYRASEKKRVERTNFVPGRSEVSPELDRKVSPHYAVFRGPSLRGRPGSGGIAGGGSGIRTHDTVSRIHAFQASAFSHSATPPAHGDAGNIATAFGQTTGRLGQTNPGAKSPRSRQVDARRNFASIFRPSDCRRSLVLHRRAPPQAVAKAPAEANRPRRFGFGAGTAWNLLPMVPVEQADPGAGKRRWRRDTRDLLGLLGAPRPVVCVIWRFRACTARNFQATRRTLWSAEARLRPGLWLMRFRRPWRCPTLPS